MIIVKILGITILGLLLYEIGNSLIILPSKIEKFIGLFLAVMGMGILIFLLVILVLASIPNSNL